jgi:hypothetical protein
VSTSQSIGGEVPAPRARLAEVSSRVRSPEVVALGLALAATLIVALSQGPKIFYFDSGNYWALGETFIKRGNFSLLNFNSPLRGYVLPLIDHGLRGFAQAFHWRDSTTAKLFNALVFSLLSATLAPLLAEACWPARRWSVRRRLGLTALFILFWSGYLNFPLSDFPALAAVLLAIVAVTRAEKLGWVLVAGIATGIAIDMRPSYILLAPLVLMLASWRWFERRRDEGSLAAGRLAVYLVLLLASFTAVSLPQSLISHRYFHTWSFVPGSAIHLESLQLTEGLRLQRVGGYVGLGHPPLMVYEDESGQKLLAMQKEHVVVGLDQYLGLVEDHPITMAGVFLRHVTNGLDQRYSTPYIEHLDSGSHRWLRLFGFLLVFLGLLRVLWPKARHSLGTTRWRYPIALLICCLTAVPSAMEPRYMLPVYLLSYMLVLAPGWPNPIDNEAVGVRRFGALAIIVMAYALFMVVVLHVVGEASNHLHFAS